VITLAFYKGTAAENPSARFFDQLVCWRTHGRFSHCEIVVDPATGLCASSSLRDHGVRFKYINLHSGRWELVTVPGDVDKAVEWFKAREGAPYDWFGLLAWAVPWRVDRRGRWFCSESCAAALGLPQPWGISPNDLYHIAVSTSILTGNWPQPAGDCL
jgi:hypothetical protein